MSDSIISQVKECFSDKQQWEAFCILADKKEEIRDGWWLKLKPALNQRFSPENLEEGWEFYSIDDYYIWGLKDFGCDALCIGLFKGSDGNIGETTDFCLYADPEVVNIETVYQLLREKKYSPVLNAFERRDLMLDDKYKSEGYVVVEYGNWEFNDKDDGTLNLDKIAWYANYNTDLFVQQIERKVFAFMKNEKVTQLLTEINEKANIKIQKEKAKKEKVKMRKK
jgi:hypothetical protein